MVERNTDPDLREIQNLKEKIEIKIESIEKAIAITERYPTLLDTAKTELKELLLVAIGHLKELHEEKFKRIDTMILERDAHIAEAQANRRIAVDSAFVAAEKAVAEQNRTNALAVAKSEATFTKQIDQIMNLMATMAKNTDDKIDDLKTRQKLGEGKAQGIGSLAGVIFSVIGAIAAIAGMVALFYAAKN